MKKRIYLTAAIILVLCMTVLPSYAGEVSLEGAQINAWSWDPSEGDPKKAIDGDATTFWHSSWSVEGESSQNDYPQVLAVELPAAVTINAISELPRPGAANGAINEIEIWISETASIADIKTIDDARKTEGWTKVGGGILSPTDGSYDTVVFDPVNVKSFKVFVLDGVGGWASIAELKLYNGDEPKSTVYVPKPKPETTAAPETTKAPETTAADTAAASETAAGETTAAASSDATTSELPVTAIAIGVIAGIAVIVIIVVIIAKNKSKK